MTPPPTTSTTRPDPASIPPEVLRKIARIIVDSERRRALAEQARQVSA